MVKNTSLYSSAARFILDFRRIEVIGMQIQLFARSLREFASTKLISIIIDGPIYYFCTHTKLVCSEKDYLAAGVVPLYTPQQGFAPGLQ